MHFDSRLTEVLAYVIAGAAVVASLLAGFFAGRAAAGFGARRAIAERERDLLTAQKGFKLVYEQESSALRIERDQLAARVKSLETRVEDLRKKAAGFGGLFGGAGAARRAEAMYALLLENEALEEALAASGEKLGRERADALAEQVRATGYRRVLISQLLRDDRIKGYVNDVLGDDRNLPAPVASPALPPRPDAG